MTGEPYTAYAGCNGPANFGLEPERVKQYNVQAKERIAAEQKEDQKAEETRLQLGEFAHGMREGVLSFLPTPRAPLASPPLCLLAILRFFDVQC